MESHRENSSSMLIKILNSTILTRSFSNTLDKSIIIGIFDSDETQVKVIQNKDISVFSIIIQPENISTELLFLEHDFKQIINGKRLYNGLEFDKTTKKNNNDLTINLGGDNNSLNKAGKNVIIDSFVFNLQNENIALSKESFAQSVSQGVIAISDQSWLNFEHIFKEISEIISIDKSSISAC